MKKEDDFNQTQYLKLYGLIKEGKTKECIQYIKDNDINLAMGGNMFFKDCSALGDLKMIKFLLTQKDVTPYDNNNCALLHAVHNGHFYIVELFLKDKNAKTNSQNNSIIKSLFYNDYQYDHGKEAGLPIRDKEKMLYVLFSHPEIYNSLKIENSKSYLKIKKFIKPLLIGKKLSFF